MLAVVDAHHHLWDLSLRAQPWLCGTPLADFRYGDYAPIRQDFLLADYRRATAGLGVVASVTMEAEWDEARLLDETRWTEARHREDGRFPAAHVARTVLHLPDAEEQLARQASFPFVRGIRHKPATARSPDRIESGAKAGMSDPAWRRGFRALGAHGLHFELQAPWWHVDELLDLIAAFPETAVVVNHAFLPADRTEGALAGWRAAIRRAATAPSVTMKISGIGLPGRPWSLDDNRGIIRDLVDAFGPRRCLFASNFPVDGLCGTFSTILGGVRAAIADLDALEQRAILHDNAVRLYRLEAAVGG